MNLLGVSMIINDQEIEVIIKKKVMKNIYFRINNEGQLLVTCPLFTTKFEINRLLEKNKKSIAKMYDRYLTSNNKKSKILYLGNELNFINYNKIFIDGDTIYAPSIESANKYLEKISLSIFEERMKLYIGEFLNIPQFRLRVRKMKTRWGVNNFKSKTITLNTELIHYRYACMDYVIVHELSHFYHRDHSVNFWKEVEKHYPNYKAIRKELRY